MNTDHECSSYDFRLLYQVQDQHFWFKHRRKIILDYIQRYHPKWQSSRFLEIGCGTGNVMFELDKNGIECLGGDYFIDALKYVRKRLNVSLCQLDIENLPFSESIDNICIFDVLEHIEDDEKALMSIHTALIPKGYLILTVPAFDYLWSVIDDIAYHKRRYTIQSITKTLNHCGFQVIGASYFLTTLFPLYYLSRMFVKYNKYDCNDAQRHAKKELSTSSILNRILYFILQPERFLLRFVNLPIGSSLIAIARKL